MKQCIRCKKVKDISKFFNRSRNPDGLNGYCKKCKKKSQDAAFERKYRSLEEEHNLSRQGVYAFLLNGVIIYIGHSTNVGKRIYAHLYNNKKGSMTRKLGKDVARLLEIKMLAVTDTKEGGHWLEAALISEHQPLLNKNSK